MVDFPAPHVWLPKRISVSNGIWRYEYEPLWTYEPTIMGVHCASHAWGYLSSIMSSICLKQGFRGAKFSLWELLKKMVLHFSKIYTLAGAMCHTIRTMQNLGLILMTLWTLSTGRQSEEHKEAPCQSQACKHLRRRHTPPFHPEIARIFRRISECVSKKCEESSK